MNVNTAGTTSFTGIVGGSTPLVSLTTNAGGSTSVGTSAVSTTGTQTYNDAVTLGQTTTLTATTATFNGTVTGNSHGLTVVGCAIFGDEAGDTVGGLTTLEVTQAAKVYTSGVSTSGAQAYDARSADPPGSASASRRAELTPRESACCRP